jgi:hypothetical protein
MIEPPANATDTTLSNHNIHLYNLAGSPLARSSPILPNEIILIRNAWTGAGDCYERLVSAPSWGGAVFITRLSFQHLADGEWLMDETINFRLKQLQARNDAAVAERPITILNTVPATRYLNSFFFPKLVDLDRDGVTMRGYEWPNLKRMAKKQLPSLCSLDRIVAVLNLRSSHWATAVCDLEQRSFAYHDSMVNCGEGGGYDDDDNGLWRADEFRDGFVAGLRRCLSDHAAALDAAAGPGSGGVHAARVAGVADWPLRDEGALGVSPQQTDLCDCGLFALASAGALGAGEALTHNQRDMPYLRRRLTIELLQGEDAV